MLLADEVGLGKTIEAGLIFSSLKSLGRGERVLVLVPEALKHQWLAEMYRRFNEMFSLIDEDRSEQEELSQGTSAFAANQRISTDSVNGACKLTLPAGAGAHIDLSTVNGSTRCDFPVTIEKSSRSTLRGTIGGGGATIKADTVNGSIHLVKL